MKDGLIYERIILIGMIISRSCIYQYISKYIYIHILACKIYMYKKKILQSIGSTVFSDGMSLCIWYVVVVRYIIDCFGKNVKKVGVS